jgi:indolepyruvate ferredoxin oxidoreductase beta subunit
MKNRNAVTIHIVGVGGQGALTVSRIIGNAALDKGVRIVISEIHGMAQRGGVVQTTIRLGDTISPLPFASDLNVILGFEPMEVYRAREMITSESVVIINRDPIRPVSVSSGGMTYPDVDEIISEVSKNAGKVYSLSAIEKALKAGNPRVTNVVMLGAVAATDVLPFTTGELKKAIEISVPETTIEANLEAFRMGYETVRGSHR